jgi:mannose-6-phosphate isomerase-like protein (cupin superfamily)
VEDGQMIKIKENPNNGNGFDTVHTFESWKVAFITCAEQYGEIKLVKRHTQTDETFLLAQGNATLFTADGNEKLEKTDLEKEKFYLVEKNTWHHLQVSKDALLIVTENSNTSKDNTESRILTEEEIKELTKC